VQLIRIGYWLGDHAPGYPDVHDFVDTEWDAEERRSVAEWLQAGESNPWIHYLGTSTCRFCGIENGSDELTDGVYQWPEGLWHYIEKHEVRLPAAIVKHALQQQPIDRQNLAALKSFRESQPRSSDRRLPISEAWWNRQGPDWRRADLTERERQMARYIARGFPIREIARELGLNHYLVAVSMQRLFDKVGARDSESFLSWMQVQLPPDPNSPRSGGV
jgi:DNA-binding CsgD family transcriptional regulator